MNCALHMRRITEPVDINSYKNSQESNTNAVMKDPVPDLKLYSSSGASHPYLVMQPDYSSKSEKSFFVIIQTSAPSSNTPEATASVSLETATTDSLSMHFRPVGMPKDAGYLFPHKVRQIRAYATPSFLQPRQNSSPKS
jgi:hypothetical protein